MVVAAFALSAVTGGNSTPTPSDTGVVTASAPPHAAAEQADCTKLLEKLPITLRSLPGRVVHTVPDTPFVVAWGAPAIIVRCGVDRPKDLVPGSSAQFVDGGRVAGPYYDVTSSDGANVFTTVDRGPYISITIPAKYQGADYLPPLSDAIAAALPAVCATKSADPDKLCTRRS